VTSVANSGTEAIASIALDDEGTVVARTPWAQRPTAGSRVGVTWSSVDEHRFDAVTGARL
jgi:hypothetical protein